MMCDNQHYYIGMTGHSSNYFIYDWMGSVYDCYILISRSLYDLFEPLETISLLKFIFVSDEALGSFTTDHREREFHVIISQTCFINVSILYPENVHCSE